MLEYELYKLNRQKTLTESNVNIYKEQIIEKLQSMPEMLKPIEEKKSKKSFLEKILSMFK